jgi:gas vesicle protein
VTPEQTTLIVGAITALLGAIGIPTYAQRLRSRAGISSGTKDIVQMYREEVDRLQKRIDEMQVSHASEMAKARLDSDLAMQAMEDKWSKQHLVDQDRISTLQGEVDGLYRRLYQPPVTPA